MTTNIAAESKFAAAALPCALFQGASSRPHGATVVLTMPAAVPFQGRIVSDVKRGGQGSRAWSPPV